MKNCEHANQIDYLLYANGKCIQCRRAIGRKHYENNRDKVLKKADEYRKRNPEKVREIKKIYYERVRNLTLKHLDSKMTARERFYVNKLKSIIYTISMLERRYRKHCGIETNCDTEIKTDNKWFC
jgi:hypothetical protein